MKTQKPNKDGALLSLLCLPFSILGLARFIYLFSGDFDGYHVIAVWSLDANHGSDFRAFCWVRNNSKRSRQFKKMIRFSGPLRPRGSLQCRFPAPSVNPANLGGPHRSRLGFLSVLIKLMMEYPLL